MPDPHTRPFETVCMYAIAQTDEWAGRWSAPVFSRWTWRGWPAITALWQGSRWRQPASTPSPRLFLRKNPRWPGAVMQRQPAAGLGVTACATTVTSAISPQGVDQALPNELVVFGEVGDECHGTCPGKSWTAGQVVDEAASSMRRRALGKVPSLGARACLAGCLCAPSNRGPGAASYSQGRHSLRCLPLPAFYIDENLS